MWGKIIIPMYRLWLNGLYGLYGPRCPLSSKRPINLISLSLSRWFAQSFVQTQIKENTKAGLCEENSLVTVTGEFPSQRASIMENVSSWWHHGQGFVHPAHCQYRGCWWPGDARNQGISSHGIDHVCLQYSGLSTIGSNHWGRLMHISRVSCQKGPICHA